MSEFVTIALQNTRRWESRLHRQSVHRSEKASTSDKQYFPIRELIAHEQDDEQADGETQGQPDHVDHREAAVPAQRAEGDFEVRAQHDMRSGMAKIGRAEPPITSLNRNAIGVPPVLPTPQRL